MTVLFVFVIGFLAACGNNSDEGRADSAANAGSKDDKEASASEAINLTYFSWDPSMEETNSALIEKFEEAHPGVTIELQSYEPTDYWPKVSAMAASGNAPDVLDMSSGYVDEWASKDLLLNLQEYIDADLNEADYFTDVFNAVRYPDKENGDMYAFPYAWVSTVLFYNKDMFDEAGLEYPTNEWTWDEFLNASQELTIDTNDDGNTDQYGFWFYGRYAQIEPWIYQNNGDILNEDKTEFVVDANGKEALKFLTDLTTEHKVSPRPKDVEGTNQQDLFPTGKVAMWVDGSWNIANNRDIIGDAFDWDIATVPRGNNWSEDVTYGWPDNIAISKTTKHADMAWEFVKFMTGEERSVEEFAGGKVPIYKATAESEAWLENDQKPANKSIILEQGELIGRNSYTPGWSEWRGYGAAEGSGMNGEIDQVLDGVKTFDEALESLTPYANDVLERAN
ncbi:sugar ABC transporter substrate-binding protein [Oceanobacillus chungangensis]|uniref:Sugar ABC transporter substrate-binding protein n=2 Tax=Oceanobacillus chungangensis TaxID=1229152 RepID=A0A3D8PKE5_9BACI|nr:sugar ABC transporter substrate-binding protein [Oceanobacillus chungangensis]